MNTIKQELSNNAGILAQQIAEVTIQQMYYVHVNRAMQTKHIPNGSSGISNSHFLQKSAARQSKNGCSQQRK